MQGAIFGPPCGSFVGWHNQEYIVAMRIPPAFQSALDALQNEQVSGREKGLPAGSLRFGDLGKQGWNILRGDVPLPAMVIRWADVDHNIRLMQDYCDRRGAWLAPHGKTSMAPQIFAAQLEAGAWAITLANIPQLQVARSFGMDRVLLANEAINDYDVRFLARALPEAQLVLRSGGYVTHDAVHYAEGSPLGGKLGPADTEAQLRPALEIWATVLSRPEPDLAILSMGKRDVPVDLDLPVPLYQSR